MTTPNGDKSPAQPCNEGLASTTEKVLVVLDGSRQITKYALEWALHNVLVRPGECITIVALYSPGSHSPVRKIWGFPMSLQMLGKDCTSSRILRSVIDHWRATKEVDEEVYDACISMIQQFESLRDQKKITINVKVQEVQGGRQAVATEAKKLGATCVVFDKHLKKEAKVCMNLLHCNIVIVTPSEPKLLRMNLKKNSRATAGRINLVQSREGSPSSQSRNGSRGSRKESPVSAWELELEPEPEPEPKPEPFESEASGPPPLCCLCQHRAPCFGKPPQRYSYRELLVATAGFSQSNFLAEGGYGYVHQGVLPDGQAIAVKQYKLASTQGDKEFCAEVEVLSCAQHRNVVMLIGFCIEGKRRLLVYEFICNGSLDGHLYGRSGTGEPEKPVLEWSSRYKVALGAARGLRYLHEECRVGCIVHRDLRPNNILLTHDFEPMVGDFGLASWQPDGHCAVETRVFGTFGYLAPEYTQHGQITDKADVYSFGVVLLELITGRKAIDIQRPKGERCLTEWARPFLEEGGTLPIDPRLENRFSSVEMNSMLHAASCCIYRDPSVRPRMAQVLRILEGEMMFGANSSPALGYFAERLKSNHTNFNSPVPGSSVEEKVKYLNSLSPQSGYNSTYASPIGNHGNLPLGPMVSSARRTKQTLVKKDSIRKLPMLSSYIGEDGQKLSYEELKAAYMGKVAASHHVTA